MNLNQNLSAIEEVVRLLTENTISILDRISSPDVHNLDDLLAERETLIGKLKQFAASCGVISYQERKYLAGLFGRLNLAMEKTVEALRSKLDQLSEQRRQNVVAKKAITKYNHSTLETPAIRLAKV